MQQVIVLNYSTSTVDVYTIPKNLNPEDWLLDNKLINKSCLWMSKEGIMRITIHD